jgi:DNA-binding transcriptional ArsR family regulator
MREDSASLTTAQLEAAIRDLRARVASLEHDSAARPSRHPRVGPDLGLIEALGALTEPAVGPDAPAGTVTYAGVAQLGTDTLAWQMTHAVPDLLMLDDTALARRLAALGSPVRLRIVRELAGGPLQVQELQERLDGPTAGQLYHHLRELLATGLVHQPRRSVYELPAGAVIPLLTLVACVGDLGTGVQDRTEEGQ